jgi:hypothetical protein
MITAPLERNPPVQSTSEKSNEGVFVQLYVGFNGGGIEVEREKRPSI